MANNIVHNHTPKSETEKPGLFDIFQKKDENKEANYNDDLTTKLYVTYSSSGLSDEEEEKIKKDKTMKEKVEENFEKGKVKMNVKIIQSTETALNLKQKTVEQIEGSKEKAEDIKLKIGEKIGGGNDEKKEAKEIEEQNANYDRMVMQSPESVSREPGDKVSEDDYIAAPPPQQVAVAAANDDTELKEKKGIFENIKGKISGYSSNNEEEIKKEKGYDKE